MDKGGGDIVNNQPFDQAFNIDDPSEVDSVYAESPMPPAFGRERSDMSGSRSPSPPGGQEYLSDQSYGQDSPGDVRFVDQGASGGAGLDDTFDAGRGRGRDRDAHGSETPSEASNSESMQSSTDEEGNGPRLEGTYDPADYEHLDVSDDVRNLFDFISAYKPKVQELPTKLQPFIPDYIPAVGDIDAFIKIPRVDGKDQGLGLEVLDEPCAKQSDPSVLDLHLRVLSKTSSGPAMKVTQVKNAESNPKAVASWVNSIEEIHREKEPQSVHYTSPMPDIDSLMQAWPGSFEDLLSSVELPTADLDVPLKEFVQICCSILDIPVYKSHVQALHLLCSLYVEFKESQHFMTEDDKAALDAEAQPSDGAPQTLSLE